MYNVVKCKVDAEDDGFEYYLGYEDDDLPTSAEIKGRTRVLRKWDKEKYGDLGINWERLLPRFTHSQEEGNDPNTRMYNGYTNVDQSGLWLGSNGWYPNLYEEEAGGCDIIEYKVRSDYGTGWQGSLVGTEGTIRFVTNVNYEEEDIKMEHPIYAVGKPDNNSMSGLIYKEGDKKDDIVAYYRGAKSNIFMVSSKSDHSIELIRAIEAFIYVPWIWGDYDGGPYPNQIPSKSQAERRVGFDCCDLVVAAWRLLGHDNIHYSNVDGTKEQMNRRLEGKFCILEGEDAVYRIQIDEEGNEVREEVDLVIGEDVHLGDVIFIDHQNDGRFDHTTVVREDIGLPEGVPNELDPADVLIMAGSEGVNGGVMRKTLLETAARGGDYQKTVFVICHW